MMNTAASTEISVSLEFTPNPDTLKYATSITLIPSGAANFLSIEEAKKSSPLAEKLFGIPSITAVMVGKDFVTITLKNQDQLNETNQKAMETIKAHLMSGEPVVTSLAPAKSTMNLSEIEKKIVEILDAEIRPAVAMDGGDITFEKYEDGFVYLKMQGSCAGCPSSLMTLKMGVETRLREAIPEIQEVIPV